MKKNAGWKLAAIFLAVTLTPHVGVCGNMGEYFSRLSISER